MRRSANQTLLGSNLYDVYWRLDVDGLPIETIVGRPALVSATWTAAIDQLATQGQLSLGVGQGSSSASPFAQGPFTEYLPRAGKYFNLQTATVPKGSAPGDYRTVFDGRIDGVDAAGQPGMVVLSCRDMMALWLNRIIEPDEPPESPDGKNGFLVPSDELISWVNALKNRVYPTFGASFIERRLANTVGIVGTGSAVNWVTEDTWIQYGANLAEKINEAFQQRGWAFHYGYKGFIDERGNFAGYDPDRFWVLADYIVQPSEVIRILKCTINDQDVRNVWDLVWGFGANRIRSRQADPVSIDKYQRRYGKFPADANINSSERASAMLSAMILDTRDPVVELEYERLYFYPVELGDKQLLRANGIHHAIDLSVSVVGYTHTLTPKAMRSVIRCQGTAIAASKRWRRGTEQRVFVNLVGDTTAGIMPEGSLVLDVDDLTPAG